MFDATVLDVIIRMWRAVAGSDEVLDTYAEHLTRTTFVEMAALPGHLGAVLSKKVDDPECALMVTTYWEDRTASGQFKGPADDDAVVKESTQKLLQSFELKVEYFETVVTTGLLAR